MLCVVCCVLCTGVLCVVFWCVVRCVLCDVCCVLCDAYCMLCVACSALLCCAVLCFVVLCCDGLRGVVLHCITLHCAAPRRAVLYCIVLYCIVLYCIVLYCIALFIGGRRPSVKTPPPHTDAPCVDERTRQCPQWAYIGYCTIGRYRKFMSNFCCISCEGKRSYFINYAVVESVMMTL